MRISISETQARRVGIPVTAELREMKQRRADLMAAADAALARMPEDASAADWRKFEDDHNKKMAEVDSLDIRIAREEDISVRNVSMRPIPSADVEARGQDDGRVFVTAEPEQTFALRHRETFLDRVKNRRGLDAPPVEVGSGAYLRAIALGARNDAERRALAEGSGSAGGYTVPDVLSAMLIDRLRAASTVFAAGAQTVPLFSDTSYIAKILTDPVPGWRLENAPIDESDPTFGRVTFQARSLAVLVKVSREILEDSLNIETALPAVLTTALAQELDRAVLFGSGVAPEPKGVINFDNLTVTSWPGSVLTLDELIDARTALRTANSDVTAYIMHPTEEGRFAKAKYGDGAFIGKGPLGDIPFLTTTKVPRGGSPATTSILAGDWRRLLVGIRSQIRVEVLRERYAENHQFAFVCHLRADVAAEHEAAFTVIDNIPAT